MIDPELRSSIFNRLQVLSLAVGSMAGIKDPLERETRKRSAQQQIQQLSKELRQALNSEEVAASGPESVKETDL